MLSAAIAWIIMGSPFLLTKKLKLQTNLTSAKLQKCLFYCGWVLLLVSIGQMIFKSNYWYIAFGLIVLFLGIYSIKTVRDWRIAQDVMDEITKENGDKDDFDDWSMDWNKF